MIVASGLAAAPLRAICTLSLGIARRYGAGLRLAATRMELLLPQQGRSHLALGLVEPRGQNTLTALEPLSVRCAVASVFCVVRCLDEAPDGSGVP